MDEKASEERLRTHRSFVYEENEPRYKVKRETDELPVYFFHQGTNYRAYEFMGVHRQKDSFIFRVWAPNADAVYVTGDFNGWTDSLRMDRISEGGIFEGELCSEEFGEGSKYKFIIERDGKYIYKADPYAFACECPPQTASVFTELEGHRWSDTLWMHNRQKKAQTGIYSKPMNIYEVHLGSFMRNSDGEHLTYGQLATELATYVKQMGYTHVELMPVAEHPYDGSWGYQICGYYAPTARFGKPTDFMDFVNTLHMAGIGVILDWVPAHFPKDAHGLYEFDGSPLYEYQGWDRKEHEGWGTRRFDVGRNEVECFLISNADMWFDKYHIDGLRVDAVASMLYLDYDKRPGEWVPNVNGENVCLEAVAFFQKLNSYIRSKYPDVMMIAEESTAFANITGWENKGLGFHYKWNMGWMNDTLSYISEDPLYRKYHHSKLNFSLTYAFSEKYILPISHDEVVHGKKSLLDRAPVPYEDKFANARALFTYMMTHPGKKLTFMGSEIGQFTEWDYKSSVEWFLLKYPKHAELQRYVSDLNNFYLTHSELYELDDTWDGFEWMDPDDNDHSIVSYCRRNKKDEVLAVVINFTPVEYPEYVLAVPFEGRFRAILSSSERRYGGASDTDDTVYVSKETDTKTGYGISIRLPSYGAMIFKCRRTRKRQRKQPIELRNTQLSDNTPIKK